MKREATKARCALPSRDDSGVALLPDRIGAREHASHRRRLDDGRSRCRHRNPEQVTERPRKAADSGKGVEKGRICVRGPPVRWERAWTAIDAKQKEVRAHWVYRHPVSKKSGNVDNRQEAVTRRRILGKIAELTDGGGRRGQHVDTLCAPAMRSPFVGQARATLASEAVPALTAVTASAVVGGAGRRF